MKQPDAAKEVPPPGPVTVLYDADCGFCTWAARRIAERLAPPGAVVLEPIRSPAGDALLGDLPEALRDGSWHLVAADGRRWSAGTALGPLLRLLPRLRWAAPLVEAAYRLVARNRATLSRLLGAERCRV